jgi:hypothetical protein
MFDYTKAPKANNLSDAQFVDLAIKQAKKVGIEPAEELHWLVDQEPGGAWVRVEGWLFVEDE